jgi:DNA-binding winged helix-turn-helix (wHTH) protein/TolB-like protein/Flp pilus assembly protein TadD
MGSFSLEENKFVLAGVEVDPTTQRIRRDEQVERIEPRMMQVLLMLARQAGEVVTREALEREVWGGRVVSDDAVTNTIAKLRRALGDDRRRPHFIETIPKRGYRLIPKPVRPVASWFGERAPFVLARWLVSAAASVLVVGLGLYAWLLPSEEQLPPTTPAVSIAVLPLTDESGQDDGYFIDGLTQDIIEELGRQRQVSVVAPSTVFGYRDVLIDDRSLGRELGTRFLVRGDISRGGGEMVLNLRMIDTSSGRELWARRFSGSGLLILDIKEQIVGSILAALQQHSNTGLTQLDMNKATDSLSAYDEFLRGRRYYGRLTPEDNAAAMHHFNQAITLDPQFARAYAALALTWTRQAIDGWTEEPEQALVEAGKLASQAAEIDPNLPQVHFVRGQIALFFGNHAAAISAAMKATRINPNYADAYGLLAWILNYGGRPRLAEKALQNALSRNPASNASYNQIAGEIQFATHRYEESVGSFEAALERNPTHARARLWLAASLVLLGRYDEAAWQVDEMLTTNPNLYSTNLLFAFPHKDPEVVDTFKQALLQLDVPELSQAIKSTAAAEF